MGRAGARLDAYAHHPYALSPSETPWSGGCAHCQTITMSTIDKLVTETRKAFGRPVRLWLTELGYQSNPPDRIAGVPLAVQATYVAAAAYRAWLTPRVDLLIQYLYRDEPAPIGGRAASRRAPGAQSPRWPRGGASGRGRAPRLDDHGLGDDPTRERGRPLPAAAADGRPLGHRRRRADARRRTGRCGGACRAGGGEAAAARRHVAGNTLVVR